MSELLTRITIRTDQCHGAPCIRGMRIRVVDVLQMLAAGMAYEEILADFDYLEPDDIRASIAYAAELLSKPMIRRMIAPDSSLL